jgi:uncharacterized protein YyaL (SSP411 family)
MNRLAAARSPYLLQHAHNPVDWYPWGEEAFARARAGDRPIFLSIGYSTCHWCHVMERESFENPEVAAVLNEHFVSIKVDREERPDVDRVYMTFVQATTGSGGWPMSVWLTPELKPFHGGTYFPPTSRWGRPGFLELLREIARVWQADRGKVQTSAEGVLAELGKGAIRSSGRAVPGEEALARTVRQFGEMFDGRHGGFGGAPKFPRPSELLFLLREYARTGDGAARDMALSTLQAMGLGGIRDHVGGGFHRYSVDAAWRVPHFEKMLYDQAQLVLAYVEAAQVSGDAFFMDVAEDTLRYVMRQMTDEAGGFYSAEDADSVPPERAGEPDAHRMEGAFYLWTSAETDARLGDDAALVKQRFGIEPDGNAPADPQQEFTGKNLLYIARTVRELAAEFLMAEAEVAEILNRARLTLFRARLDRPRPHLDDKVLTAWNGLMIAAFARTARVLRAAGGESRQSAGAYLDAARQAADFLQQLMWDEASATLLRRYRGGEAGIEAYAEDYAYLAFGLIELFQADPDPRWLSWAVTLQRRQDELFWDDEAGGWFSTTGHDGSVLLRLKEDYDGAEPAASSVSAGNLLVLSHLVEEPVWVDRIERTLALFGDRLSRMGRSVPMMAAALSAYVAGPQQIVLLVGVDDPDTPGELEQAIAVRYLPFATVIRVTPAQQVALADLLPVVAAMHPVDGHAAAYICQDFTCGPPVTRAEVLDDLLSGG